MSITHVHDVVRAHLSAVSQGKNGERYILAGEDHSVAEFVAEFARLSGTKTPRVAPAWVLKIFGRVSVMVAAIRDRRDHEPDRDGPL
ncbi:MAG: hypothetical protein JRE82_18030 [Deltaproteobacteria bacterium]|nr:hypothetical protein [Deltaproteobacteria bacterium]